MEIIKWEGNAVKLLDQTKLPFFYEYITCTSYQEVANSIINMKVRGAPAIGVAAAFGVVLAAKQKEHSCTIDLREWVNKAIFDLENTRPTAANLFWALNKMKKVLSFHVNDEPHLIISSLEKEAKKIFDEDRAVNYMIGRFGAQLLFDGAKIMTYCNAGALATAGHGTALGIMKEAHKQNNEISVIACETRPLLQGARLTVTELMEEGIDVTLITDNMAGYVMKNYKVDLVIVGADRIALNGDVANKIGTYSLAVNAQYHDVPFYVAAPFSSFDFNIASGEDIQIEERDPSEVRSFLEKPVVPEKVAVFNPAFDITPCKLITGIVTEKGILFPPFSESIKRIGVDNDG